MPIVNMPVVNKENGMPNVVPHSHRLNSKSAASHIRLRSLDKDRLSKTEDSLNHIGYLRNLTQKIPKPLI